MENDVLLTNRTVSNYHAVVGKPGDLQLFVNSPQGDLFASELTTGCKDVCLHKPSTGQGNICHRAIAELYRMTCNGSIAEILTELSTWPLVTLLKE